MCYYTWLVVHSCLLKKSSFVSWYQNKSLTGIQFKILNNLKALSCTVGCLRESEEKVTGVHSFLQVSVGTRNQGQGQGQGMHNLHCRGSGL